MECIFDQIIAGEIPCHKVFENENTLAFLDIKPHAKGHTVVVPKKHVVRVFEMEDFGDFMEDVKKVMEILDNKLNPSGFNVGWNHNHSAGQVIPHLHIHIFPRYGGDGGGSMHSVVNSPSDVEEVARLFE
jgi:histidine triad (HIT) family protein